MEHFKNVLRGLSDALTIVPPARGYRVEKNGHALDAARLRNDFATLGDDMRGVIKRDKQAHQRASKGE